MVWLASGNNMQFKGDTARRIVPIDLDPKMERPEERTGFQHTPLTSWVQQERPRLTVAALTIIKAYFEAGCPAQSVTPMGSFEQWSDLVRQALIWAGEADPNEGRHGIEAESDPEYEKLATLLQTWETCYPIPQGHPCSPAKTLKDVLADIAALKAMDKPPSVPGKPNTPNEYDALQDALGAFDAKYDGKGLRSDPVSYKLRAIKGFLSPFGDITLWNIVASCVVLPYTSPYSCVTNLMLLGYILPVVLETSSMEGGDRFHLDTSHDRPDPLVTGCHAPAP